jgi:hypothetical protein
MSRNVPQQFMALVIGAALTATPPAAAQYTWTGANSQPQIINDPVDWSNPFNWSGNSIPTSGSSTTITFAGAPSGTSINNLGPFTVSVLEFDTGIALQGAPLTFSNSGVRRIIYATTAGVAVTNNLSIPGPAGLTVSGNASTVSGTISLTGAISGAGALNVGINGGGDANFIANLTNAGNTYSGGTGLYTLGTVRPTVTGALPAGKPVTIASGTLDLGGTNQSIGSLTLSQPSSGPGSARPIVTNTGSGVLTLGGDITYSPNSNNTSPSAVIRSNLDLGGATRTINVTGHSADLYDVTITGQISGAGGVTVTGSPLNYVALTGVSNYTGPTTVNTAVLFLATTNALPVTSPVVLSSGGYLDASPFPPSSPDVTPGNYSQSIGSLTGPAGTTVALYSGTLTIGNDNSNAVYSGSLSLAGSTLVKVGYGTQTLAGANGQAGTIVNGGTLAVTADAALGPAANPVTVNAFGTLTYTNATNATGRPFTLNNGTLTADATVGLNNCTVAGGFLAGPGTFVVNGTGMSGVTTANSAVISQTGVASFTNFSNGGSLTVGAGLPSNITRFTNQGSGSITANAGAELNVTDFQTYGTLTLNPGSTAVPTQFTNGFSSPLYFNGGSRTFISIPAHAGQFDAGIELFGQNAVVAGGLFVNNGYVVDSLGAGTKTVIADFGSLVKGAGFFQNSVQTVNGGKFQSGNSPGQASFGSFVFGPGGVNNYVFAIDDAAGTAGPSPDANGQVSGWGLVNVVGRASLPASRLGRSLALPNISGDFAWSADASRPLTMHLDTLVNPTTVGTDIAGPMADFDPAKPYSWLAATWAGNYSGPTDPALLTAATAFDTSGFANPIVGTFGWNLDLTDRTLSLTYTPSAVPEPGSLALAWVVTAFGFAVRRRRRCARL